MEYVKDIRIVPMNYFSYYVFCPYESLQYERKGYNTRESIRANSLAINLGNSRVCGFYNFSKIPVSALKVLSEAHTEEVATFQVLWCQL